MPEEKSSSAASISVRALVFGVVVIVLVAAVGVLAWLQCQARGDLDALRQQQRDDVHAEQVALDYAVGAATMDHKDLGAWSNRLVAGTAPELAKRLTDAAATMEQIIVPLEWSSTPTPLAAKVRSNVDGVYTVDSFVSVRTTNVQAPEGLSSTATYSVTIDSGAGWQITDVGGIGALVEGD